MSEMNRREFVTAAAALAALTCLSCSGSEALAAPGATGGTVNIGTLADYSKDGINPKFIRANKLAVVRSDGKIYACSAICTHKFGVLTVNGDHFHCPKHGSEFSMQGTVTKKPAQDSLVRYAIKKDDAGHLTVDTAKSFSEKDWDNADAFVSIT